MCPLHWPAHAEGKELHRNRYSWGPTTWGEGGKTVDLAPCHAVLCDGHPKGKAATWEAAGHESHPLLQWVEMEAGAAGDPGTPGLGPG